MPKAKFNLDKYRSPYYSGVNTVSWKVPISFREHPDVTSTIAARNCRVNYSKLVNGVLVYARRAEATHFTILEKTDSQL